MITKEILGEQVVISVVQEMQRGGIDIRKVGDLMRVLWEVGCHMRGGVYHLM